MLMETKKYAEHCGLPVSTLRRFYEDACRRSRERQVNTYVLTTGNGSILALLEGTDMTKRIGGREGGRE